MLNIYTDAATKGNPGLSGAGIIILKEKQQIQLSYPLSVMTNHEAEFCAVVLALEYILAQQLQQETILLHSDSKLVVQTIEKNYAQNQLFHNYLEKINGLTSKIELILFQWIPESKNKGADHLARQGLRKAQKGEKNG